MTQPFTNSRIQLSREPKERYFIRSLGRLIYRNTFTRGLMAVLALMLGACLVWREWHMGAHAVPILLAFAVGAVVEPPPDRDVWLWPTCRSWQWIEVLVEQYFIGLSSVRVMSALVAELISGLAHGFLFAGVVLPCSQFGPLYWGVLLGASLIWATVVSFPRARRRYRERNAYLHVTS